MVREVSGSLKEEEYGVLCFRNTFKKVDVDGSGEINMQVNLKHHQPKHLKVAKQFIPSKTVKPLKGYLQFTHPSTVHISGHSIQIASLVGAESQNQYKIRLSKPVLPQYQ